MALSSCRRCGRLVAVDSRFCPACGLRSPAPSTGTRLAWIVGLVALLALVLVLLFIRR